MSTLIIGGGIAGLVAARELDRAGRRVVLIEPRARLGGRIMTRNSRVHGFAVDLGPEFVHGNPPETRALVPDHARDILRLEERQRLYWRGEIKPYDGERIGEIFDALGESQPDRSVSTALGEMGLDEVSQAMTNAFAEGFNAAVAPRMSVNAMVREARAAAENLLENYRLLPGYASLVDHVRDEFKTVDVRLNQTVTEVRWRKGHATVRVARPDGEYEETFEHVVCTVPTSCIPDIHFEPAIPEHVAAARLLPMGHVQKIVFTFREALWPKAADADIDFLHSPEFTFSTRWAWGWVDPFTLTCWSGGARAETLSGLDEAVIVDRALTELARVTNRPVATLRALVDEVFHHDWSTDTHSRGAYSYVVTGGEDARERLSTPIEGTLFFAGEAADTSGAPGTVHGAIRTGIKASQAILGTGAV